jgi:MATE family multidrug resistance protein
MAYTGLFAVMYLTVPKWFLVMHMAFAAEDFTAVQEAIVVLLRFVALYCFFDALQIVLIGALRGAGDTRFILMATSLISIVSVTIGRLCEDYFHWREYGVALWGWWWILTAWVLALGLVYLLRFLGGKWRDMRVIEPEIVEDEKQAETGFLSAECGMQSAE